MFVEAAISDSVLRGAILTFAALLWVLVLARIVGLRSFSKMTAFDFVATIASGSLLANAAVATGWTAFVQPMTALCALFSVQFILAWWRQRSNGFRRLVDNRPRMLMRDGEIDMSALRETRVSRADVIAKMREANAGQFDDVRYIVLEATGDISVIHKTDVDHELIADVD